MFNHLVCVLWKGWWLIDLVRHLLTVARSIRNSACEGDLVRLYHIIAYFIFYQSAMFQTRPEPDIITIIRSDPRFGPQKERRKKEKNKEKKRHVIKISHGHVTVTIS